MIQQIRCNRNIINPTSTIGVDQCILNSDIQIPLSETDVIDVEMVDRIVKFSTLGKTWGFFTKLDAPVEFTYIDNNGNEFTEVGTILALSKKPQSITVNPNPVVEYTKTHYVFDFNPLEL